MLNCIFQILSYKLHLENCILQIISQITSCKLHLTNCISQIASCKRHLTNCIVHLESFIVTLQTVSSNIGQLPSKVVFHKTVCLQKLTPNCSGHTLIGPVGPLGSLSYLNYPIRFQYNYSF